jgi:hypothetical protein
MHDLAFSIGSHELSQIVIPGSHDSVSYSLPAPDDDAWHTQSDDLIHQLDGGIRVFDIRVECFPSQGDPSQGVCLAHHGPPGSPLDGVSNWLDTARIFSDIESWAQEPGHSQEIIILDLGMAQHNDNVAGYWPQAECQSFGQKMGDALVTPKELQDHKLSTDPGQVTVGDFWSLPDPNGSARVILENSWCLNKARPDAGYWSPDPPSGSYYADQCNVHPVALVNQTQGIRDPVLTAVKTRAAGAGGVPNAIGPSVKGGLYALFVQGTPELGCTPTPTQMLGDQAQVLAALYEQWQTDRDTKANLNIVSGDFVQRSDIYKDVIAMDETFTPALTKKSPSAMRVKENKNGGPPVIVQLKSGGEPAAGAQVTFTISPAQSQGGRWVTPSFPRSTSSEAPTWTATTDRNGIAQSDNIDSGSQPGQYDVTATANGVSTSFTLQVTEG